MDTDLRAEETATWGVFRAFTALGEEHLVPTQRSTGVPRHVDEDAIAQALDRAGRPVCLDKDVAGRHRIVREASWPEGAAMPEPDISYAELLAEADQQVELTLRIPAALRDRLAGLAGNQTVPVFCIQLLKVFASSGMGPRLAGPPRFNVWVGLRSWLVPDHPLPMALRPMAAMIRQGSQPLTLGRAERIRSMIAGIGRNDDKRQLYKMIAEMSDTTLALIHREAGFTVEEAGRIQSIARRLLDDPTEGLDALLALPDDELVALIDPRAASPTDNESGS
jgi:hypothetical protein